ncbi:MAG: iron ABC transporter permease [Thermodesulfobacteriota bacterium]
MKATQTTHRRRLLLIATFGAAVLAAMMLNTVIGSVHISLPELWSLFLQSSDSANADILWKIRLPRVIAAVLGGAMLAVSGLLLQVFFRNPIVGPFVLGISSAATLLVAIVMLSTLSLGFAGVSPYVNTLAALTGAYGTMAIILLVTAKVKSGVTLLIIGLMMGYLNGAVTSILVAFAEREKIKQFVLWQFGSFSGFSWHELFVLSTLGGLLLCGVYALSKPLNAFLLGEEYALSMGVNIKLFRFLIVLVACALAGLVTAAAGPVAFIGLAVPHMARLSLKTSDARLLIPGVLLLGAAITSLCDLVARQLFSPVEVPISAITACFGAPIVIGLLLKRKTSL